MLAIEEYMWEHKIGCLKNYVRVCESGCGENSNEPTCSVSDKELNEWVSNS